MPTSWTLRTLPHLALAFAILSQVLGINPPPLPIVWNPSAKANDWNMFTLLASFPKNTDIDDATLVGLTRQAWGVMQSNTDFKSMEKQPSAMAALKVGNEVFFASSVRGHGFTSFAYDWLTPKSSTSDPSRASDSSTEQVAALPNTDITPFDLETMVESLTDIEVQLEACRTQIMQKRIDNKKVGTDPGRHRSLANCAEVMALHMYNVEHPLGGPDGIRDQHAVVATWAVDHFGKGPMLYPACGAADYAPAKWGCRKFMESVGVRPIQEMDSVAIRDNTVAPTSVKQINLCERYLSIEPRGD